MIVYSLRFLQFRVPKVETCSEPTAQIDYSLNTIYLPGLQRDPTTLCRQHLRC